MQGSKKVSWGVRAAAVKGRLSGESGWADHLPPDVLPAGGGLGAMAPAQSDLKPAERTGKGPFLLVSHQVRSKSPSPATALSVPSLLLSQAFVPAAPELQMPCPHSLC